ncbi:MAG: DUF6531 domain-containing protein [Acidobacteriia bacterium]|nr:DUF6531 domain-containing protein [Terriglobia bacterium]
MPTSPDCDLNLVAGKVSLGTFEFFFPAALPCYLERAYDSYRREMDGPFGYGWQHNFDIYAEISNDSVLAHGIENTPLIFNRNDDGGFERSTLGYELEIDPAQLVIADSEGQRFVFARVSSLLDKLALSEISNLDGISIRLDYDIAGRITAVIDNSGRIIRFTYDGASHILSIDVWHPSVNQPPFTLAFFEYNASGDLVTAYDLAGRATRYEYDSHFLVAVTNAWGGTQYLAYDDNGLAVATWRSDGTEVRLIRRTSDTTAIEETNGLGYRWIYFLNENGEVQTRIDPLHRVKTANFDLAGGQLASDLSTMGGNALTVWNEERNIETTTFGATRRVIEYNKYDKPCRISDAAGNDWRFDYDSKGHLARIEAPGGSVCAMSYSESGELTEFRQPCGNVQRFERGAFFTNVEDNLGRVWSCSYDLLGRPVLFTDSGGRTTQFEWGHADLAAVRLANGSRIQYYWDAGGYPSEVVYSSTSRVRMASDTFGRPVLLETAHGGRYTFVFDREGRPATITDTKGARASYEYDAVGRITNLTTFDGRVVATEYDEFDNQVAVRSGAVESVSEFDTAGLMAHHQSTNGASWSYGYGPNRELLLAVADHGVWKFEFDEARRPIKEGNPVREISFGYDTQRLRTFLEDNRGLRIDYEWDIRSRLSALMVNQKWKFRLEYDSSNLVRCIHWPGGLRVEFEYDEMRQVTRRSLCREDGQVLADRQYRWAPSGYLEWFRDADRGECRLTVDGSSRLTGVQCHDGRTETYMYDPSSNVLNTAAGEPIVMGEGNRWVRAGEEAFEFGVSGAVTRTQAPLGSRTFQYDGDGALISWADEGQPPVRCCYDPFGRRIRTESDGAVTEYLWDGFAFQGEIRSGGDPVWYLTPPGIPVPLAIISGDQVFGLLFDQLGTVTDAFDLGGERAWRGDYDGLLGLVFEHGPLRQPLRGMGQYHDRDAGLYYNWRRYYNPRIGRYMSPEPYGYRNAINEYAFSLNTTIAGDAQGLLSMSLSAGGVLEVTPTCGWPAHIQDDFNAKVQDYKAAIKNSGGKGLTRQVNVRTHCDQEKEWDNCIEKVKQKQASGKPLDPKDNEKLAANERLENYRARMARRKPLPVKSGSGKLKRRRYSCRDVDVDHRVEDVLSNDNGCDNLMPRNTHMNTAWGGAMSNILAQMQAQGTAITSIVPKPCEGKSEC